MKHKVLILLVVAGLAAILVGQTPPTQPSNSGRYQIFFSPHARADTFMVDEQTGKVWQFVTFTDIEDGPHAWRPVLRFDSEAEVGTWAAKQIFKK